MRKKIDVLIFVEHRSREFESAALLKVLFEKKGYSVAVESIQFNKESVILKYYPKIVVVPWVYGEREVNIFSNFNIGRKTPIIILNMHQEQLTNEGSMSFLLPSDRARNVYHLSWGEFFTSELSKIGCNTNSIIQSGNVRLDFYKSKLRKITPDKEKLSRRYNLDSTKKWVLFIANSFHLISEKEKQNLIDKGVDVSDQIACSIDCRNDFLKFSDKYLSENSDTIIIYRPHPCHVSREASRSEIIELENKYDNFRCISEEAIRDWILNCDVSISFHSTSAIESLVANKPYYLIRTHDINASKDYSFFSNYDYKVKSYEDFYRMLKNYEDFTFDNFKKEITTQLDINTDVLSAELAVDLFDDVMLSNDIVFFNCFPNMSIITKTILRSLIKKGIYFLSKIDTIQKYFISLNNPKIYNAMQIGDDYWDQNELSILAEKLKILLKDNEKLKGESTIL